MSLITSLMPFLEKVLRKIVGGWAKTDRDRDEWLQCLENQKIHDIDDLKDLTKNEDQWQVMIQMVTQEQPMLAIKFKLWKEHLDVPVLQDLDISTLVSPSCLQ